MSTTSQSRLSHSNRSIFHRVGTFGLALVATLALTITGAEAQTLYATAEPGAVLLTVEPASGEQITSIGSLTNASGVNSAQAIAMDPLSGTMYIVFPTSGVGNPWTLGTLNLATGAITTVATLDPNRIRDMTFDSAGTLWAVTGSVATNAHSLVTINTSTGALTLQNGSLPTTRNKIAYRVVSNELFILGSNGGSVEMHRFSPGTPGSLTQVTLSGGTLSASSQPPLVHNPLTGNFLTNNASNWFTITPAGTVTQVNSGGSISPHGGLAFDQATTTLPVELSVFSAN